MGPKNRLTACNVTLLKPQIKLEMLIKEAQVINIASKRVGVEWLQDSSFRSLCDVILFQVDNTHVTCHFEPSIIQQAYYSTLGDVQLTDPHRDVA